MTPLRAQLEFLPAHQTRFHSLVNPRSKSLFQVSSDSIAKCLIRRSIETCPPMISDGAYSKADVGREDIYRNLKLWSNVKLGKREEEEECSSTREVERQEVTSQDKTVEWLSVQIAQRDNIIKQLEELVSQQQKLLEETLLSCEEKKPIRVERPRAIAEGKDYEEILSSFQHRFAERKKKREYITKRRMEMNRIVKEIL